MSTEKPEEPDERDFAHEKLIRQRQRQLSEMRPAIYVDLVKPASAPKPQQFEYVATWLTAKTSAYFRENKNGLFCFGKSGQGKTAAVWAMVETFWKECPANDITFLKTVAFFSKAKSKHLSREYRVSFDDVMQDALQTDVLILDDFGTEKLTDSTESVAFELLDTRTEHELPTVITSNYSIAQLADFFTDKNKAKIRRRIEQFFLPVNFDK